MFMCMDYNRCDDYEGWMVVLESPGRCPSWESRADVYPAFKYSPFSAVADIQDSKSHEILRVMLT